MHRRMLFKIGVTLVIGVGIILFYLVNVQDIDKPNVYQTFHYDLEDKQLSGVYAKNTLVKVPDHKEEGEEEKQEHQEVQHKKTTELYPDLVVANESEANEKDDQVFLFKEQHFQPVIQSAQQYYGNVVQLCVVVCGSRGEETMVMLKSAVMVTPFSVGLVFHIITEPDTQRYFQDQFEAWPKVYRQRLSYNIYNISFPGGATSDSWKKLFKPCASQRLFLPDLLKSVDSLIYVDTDTLFLNSLSDLWVHFSKMNQSQLVGVVPEAEDGTAGWYNRFANHPYYGEFGVNSGVMLMNLTRLRKTSWLSDMQIFYNKYRMMIPWGDQDLINIFFAAHPDQLYLMSCSWNFRTDHCRYLSNCRSAEQDGISVLHGSRRMFYEEKEPAFGVVFNTFKNFQLGGDLDSQFLQVMNRNLNEAKPSNCGKLADLFLKQLKHLVEINAELHVLQEKEQSQHKYPNGNQSSVEQFNVQKRRNNPGDNVQVNPRREVFIEDNRNMNIPLAEGDKNDLNNYIEPGMNVQPDADTNAELGEDLENMNAEIGEDSSLKDLENNVGDNEGGVIYGESKNDVNSNVNEGVINMENNDNNVRAKDNVINIENKDNNLNNKLKNVNALPGLEGVDKRDLNEAVLGDSHADGNNVYIPKQNNIRVEQNI